MILNELLFKVTGQLVHIEATLWYNIFTPVYITGLIVSHLRIHRINIPAKSTCFNISQSVWSSSDGAKITIQSK